MRTSRRTFIGSVSAAAIVSSSGIAFGQKKYDEGVTDTEIKIGNTNPYSGPASSYGAIGKTIDAYWKSVNAAGGINGRKVNFISLDDGYSPPKTVEVVRQLVEQEKIFALFQSLGTPCNTAIHKYMNQKKVPQLYVATGASKWGDPKHFPWTMGFQPDYHTEAVIYAKHILANVKDAKIGVLMQNDDFGRDYFGGLQQGLGKEANRIIKHVTYEVTDPTVDSQVIQLKDSGASVFVNISAPKQAAQAIRKAADIGWKPAQYLVNVSVSVAAVMKPAGFDNSQGILTAFYLKDATDKQWDSDAEMKTWRAWMDKWMPGANKADANHVYGYTVSTLMHETLKRCGNTLTRENLMKQAASFQKFRIPMLLPGILVNTSPTDFYPIQAVQLARFKGESWSLFGEIMHSESA
ncbi:ABC transporter substrate-binding protein [Enhydrobacter sp.]|uniref:ABC transporter substrate-binding protein n=1 Tax=Enhydrobacter sp. TaxID=1894999 RepID=UPI00261C402E|nr:ABC transporter substrate-binding protein [Enhydrobacter sp.]WIM13118.1 MAG: ABC transporter, substrate-binding protein BBta_7080 family [Enhydrobacter sp.]